MHRKKPSYFINNRNKESGISGHISLNRDEFNPLKRGAAFLYPLKTSENLGCNGSREVSFENCTFQDKSEYYGHYYHI